MYWNMDVGVWSSRSSSDWEGEDEEAVVQSEKVVFVSVFVAAAAAFIDLVVIVLVAFICFLFLACSLVVPYYKKYEGRHLHMLWRLFTTLVGP